MVEKRSILYSHHLTGGLEYYRLLSQISQSFGYKIFNVNSEKDAIEYVRESRAGVVFCDEKLCNGDFLNKLKLNTGMHGSLSLFLIIPETPGISGSYSTNIDGYLLLSVPDDLYELSLFNIFKYISMKEKLNTLSAKKDQELIRLLLSKTAHAINNILAGMQGYSELAQMYPEDKQLIKDTFDVVLDSSQRIKNEIKNLRAFLRIENPQFDRVSMVRVLGESVLLTKTLLGAKGIDLIQRMDQDFVVNGDYDQLIQVFFNLLIDTIHICREKSRVELSLSFKKENAFVSIMGDDCEVDAEAVKTIRYFLSINVPIIAMQDIDGKVDEHNVLAICNRIIHNHGGNIDVRIEGRKIVYKVTIPILKGIFESQEMESVLTTKVYDTIDNLDMDILVVDDEEYVRNTLYYFFDSKGCRVTLAEDGEYGLQMAKEKHFNLIFMDYLMPRMGGIEAARKIKEKNKNVKIVFITGREMMDETMLYKSGVYACIKKPFEMKEIYTIAKKVALENGIIS